MSEPFKGVAFCITNENTYNGTCSIETDDPPRVVVFEGTQQFAKWAVPILNGHAELLRRLTEAEALADKALIEVAAVCVDPENPFGPEAFPQLENPADRECLAKAITILQQLLAPSAPQQSAYVKLPPARNRQQAMCTVTCCNCGRLNNYEWAQQNGWLKSTCGTNELYLCGQCGASLVPTAAGEKG